MALVVLATIVLTARLFQVQVTEHAIWAKEAANLVRSWQVIPYMRGRIFDREGRVIVEDRRVYELDLVYRDFRRGQSLGQVAHARSILEQRAVSLDEALHSIVSWALELIWLSPEEIDGFVRGEGLRTRTLEIPPAGEGSSRLRARRASDLRFYIGRLLRLNRRELGRLRKWKGEDRWDEPFVHLVARLRDRSSDEVEADLVRRLLETHDDLSRLAELFSEARGTENGGVESLARASMMVHPTGDPALDALLTELEEVRREVEDACATELFRTAAGFSPGRVTPQALGRMNLSWLTELLGWDASRLAQWRSERRAAWEGWRDHVAVPALVYRLDAFEPAEELCSERWLSALASLVSADPLDFEQDPRAWRGVEKLAVLDELGELFDLPQVDQDALSIQYDALRDSKLPYERRFWLLGYSLMSEDPLDGKLPETDGELALAISSEDWSRQESVAGRFRAQIETERSRHRTDELRLRSIRLVKSWETHLQARVEATISAGLAEQGGETLEMSPERIDAAREEHRYVIRDRGSRPVRRRGHPTFEVVHMITRHPEIYRGFRVREASSRQAREFDEFDRPLFEHLIGGVRRSDMREMLSQRELRSELAALRRETSRSAAERRRIQEISRALYRADESHGGTGLEAYFDPELRGRNGFRESQGLQERRESGRPALYEEPVDGSDLTLTLDIELQRAALWTLEHPEHDARDPKRDDLWLENPVGALCLTTIDGAVLVAASVPTVPHDAPDTRDGEREKARERTLRRPVFLPPGSVFKPFVAAWALEHGRLTPDVKYICEVPEGSDHANFLGLHCHSRWGHKGVNLHDALRRSCNVYFAHLGDAFSARDFVDLCDTFGFGHPTGVRTFGPDRHVRLEDPKIPALWEKLSGTSERAGKERRRAANGLSAMQATPLQVARAMTAIATGVLPELRLVSHIGEEPLPLVSRPLEVSEAHLEAVRLAMIAAVHEPLGTAFDKGLDESSLGFRLALKTGSADYAELHPAERQVGAGYSRKKRKHTWVAGWFPAEDPLFVLVVYLHDVSETASHSAVYVARQFLKTEALRAYYSGLR